MEGVDDSFSTTRNQASKLGPNIYGPHNDQSNQPVVVNNFTGLLNSSPPIAFDVLLEYWKIRQADMMGNRLVQYATQVASLTKMKEEEMFKNTYKEIMDWLKASSIQKSDVKMIVTNDDEKIGVSNIPFLVKQQTNQFIALEQLILSPTMMGDIIFSTVLAGHTRDAVQRIKDYRGLTESTENIYKILVNSVVWMPSFARLVAALIVHTNKQAYVSTPRFQLEEAKSNVISWTTKFKTFSMANARPYYIQKPEQIQVKKENIESLSTIYNI